MVRNITILSILIGLIIAATVILTGNQQHNVKDFSYVDAENHSGHLYQFTNQPVILHFWATWCIPCREELPQLIKKAAKMPNTVFLLISVDQNKQAMLNFLGSYKANNLVIINDPNETITKDHFNIDQFPETIILNKDKTIAQHLYGATDWENMHE
jgi:thiol-disulfide isomerase/thioredoxin